MSEDYDYHKQLETLLNFKVDSGNVLSAKESTDKNISFKKVNWAGRLWREIRSIIGYAPAEELEQTKIHNLAQKIKLFVNNAKDHSVTIDKLERLKTKIEDLQEYVDKKQDGSGLAHLIFSQTLRDLDEQIKEKIEIKSKKIKLKQAKIDLSSKFKDQELPSIIEYEINANNKTQIKEGNVSVDNKTDQLVTVNVKQPTEDLSMLTYHVEVSGKKLIDPITNSPFFYLKSQQITLEQKGNFIQITEKNAETEKTDIRYVDINQEVNLGTESVYKIYPYIPKTIDETTARGKIQYIVNSPLTINNLKIVYNRHGVAVYGKQLGNNVFYWASPDQIQVKREEDPVINKDGNLTSVRSEKAVFQYNKKTDEYFLNGEPALVLDTSKEKKEK